MKFRVERDALADAVAWTARTLPPGRRCRCCCRLLLEVGEEG